MADWTFYYNEGFDRGKEWVVSKLLEIPKEEVSELVYNLDHALNHEKLKVFQEWIRHIISAQEEE